MDATTALLSFSVAAALLTVTPGLDTALILRTSAAEGARPAALAGIGIITGLFAWGCASVAGLGALLALSEAGYRLLQIAGCAYLAWLGLRLLRSAWRPTPVSADASSASRTVRRGGPFWRGFLSNLLNPKVGVFYVSFLPQFIPPNVSPLAFGLLLATVHALLTTLWFALLIGATRPLAAWLRRPGVVRGLDAVTGTVFLLFGLRLALSRPPG